MVLNENENVRGEWVGEEGGYPHPSSTSIIDFITNPMVLGLLCAVSVVTIFCGVIKLKRAIPVDPSSISILSTGSFAFGSTENNSAIGVWLQRNVVATFSKPIKSFGGFWKKIPRRLWNFYVDAFMIPSYRKEWGKYQNWSYRSPPRPKRSKYIRSKLKLTMLETEEQRERRREEPSAFSILKTGSNTSIVRKHACNAIPMPEPSSHNHAECQRIRINVGGCIYETQLKTLNRYPETLLGDPQRRLKYYNPITREYFFDRHRNSFETILNFYQTGGRFRKPENLAADIMLDDAKFYGIPQGVIYQFLIDEGLTYATQPDDILPENMLLRKIWLLFDYPESSLQARMVAIISISSILLSITTFCLETESELTGRLRFDINSTTGNATEILFNPLQISDPFFIVETMCTSWFVVEHVARLASSPDKAAFLMTLLNTIDFLAIVPYFVQLLTNPALAPVASDQNSKRRKPPGATFSFIRVIRLVRVFRIFKLSRHSRGLKILGKTLQASLNELMLLIVFVIIEVILFSSLMYFMESIGDNDEAVFTSIPGGFWWALITITTVGYGDIVPKTGPGKLVGALCAVAGVLTIALPVPVIVSNFNYFYNQALGEQDLRSLKISHVPSCPFRPMEVCRGCDIHEGFFYKTQVPVGGILKHKIHSTVPDVVYSSDEQFEELKDRALRMQGIDPATRKGRRTIFR